MLYKLRITALVALVFQVLPVVFPALQLPDDFPTSVQALVAALFAIIPVVAGFFKKESQAKVDALVTNP